MIAPCKGLQGDAAQSAANQARNTGANPISHCVLYIICSVHDPLRAPFFTQAAAFRQGVGISLFNMNIHQERDFAGYTVLFRTMGF